METRRICHCSSAESPPVFSHLGSNPSQVPQPMNPCKYVSWFFSSRSPHLSPHFSHSSPALLRQHATSPLTQDLCTSRSCERKALSHICTQLPPSSDTESPLGGATPDHPTCIGSRSLWPSWPLLVNLIISLHTPPFLTGCVTPLKPWIPCEIGVAPDREPVSLIPLSEPPGPKPRSAYQQSSTLSAERDSQGPGR